MKKCCGEHALRIVAGITILIFFLLAGNASSMSNSSPGAGWDYRNSAIDSADRALTDHQMPVLSPLGAQIVRTDGSPDMPHENDLPDKYRISGMLEANGMHFELKNSSYLNVTLDNSEPINLTLKSAPEMVTIHIESASGAAEAKIILGGFLPHTTYHKYQDDYHNHTAFTTDANGSYTYTQDLSNKHLIFIQPRPSTKFIKDDATGGDCTLIGTWYSGTKTCSLMNDLTETVQIDSDGITLNGNGHTITGSDTGNGVYISGRTGVTIKNLNVRQFTYGIYLINSNNNMLNGNNASNNYKGIYLDSSSDNTMIGNIMTGNNENFELNGYTDSDFNNHIDTSNLVDGKPINYLIKASDTTYGSSSNAGTLYCISCVNVTIENLNLNKNCKGIYFWNTSHSRIQNVNVSNNEYGIYLDSSRNNTLGGNNMTSNSNLGIYMDSSSNNMLNNNIVSGNGDGNIELHYSSNNTLSGNNVGYIFIFGREGINLDYSSNNTMSGNNLTNVDIGVHLYYSSNNTFSGNNVSNNFIHGVYLYYSNNNTLDGNNASNNGYWGVNSASINLDNSNNNTLSVNNVTNNNWDGIVLSYSGNNTLNGNNVLNNSHGISVYYSSNNIMKDNNASLNHENGIYLELSSNNTLSGNNVSNYNFFGIYLNSSRNNTLGGNNVLNDRYGIFMESSSNNTLSGNNVSNNRFGISLYYSVINLWYSSDNKIYNNIFNNTDNFYFFGSNINAWNTIITLDTNIIGGPYLGGNFWGNPSGTGFSQTCVDTDKNGICDSNYEMATGNVDYLPLTIYSTKKISACGTISSPGEYALYQDIHSDASSCINITSSNVIFDGVSYTIDGIDDLKSYGVRVYNSTTVLTNVTVKNLKVTDWSNGIYYLKTKNGSIANNIANSNDENGIYLELSSNNTLSGNDASNNGYYGIPLVSLSNNNTLSGNNASNNGYAGIYLESSCNNNTISGNNASSNDQHGINLDTSSNNTLSSNLVSNNGYSGINLWYSSDNKIYNNILNNTNNFYFYGSNINAWNTTKTLGTNIIGGPYLGGNFWANPGGNGFSQDCPDMDTDGICDSNYEPAPGNADYLPLAKIPSGSGYIGGRILNNSIGINNGRVTTNTSITTNTDASGSYSLLVPAGSYKLMATGEPGFYPDNSIIVTAMAGTTFMQDIELIKKPTGNISGSVSTK